MELEVEAGLSAGRKYLRVVGEWSFPKRALVLGSGHTKNIFNADPD